MRLSARIAASVSDALELLSQTSRFSAAINQALISHILPQ